jgi:DNA mismatch endonuclease, patch repair protein
MRLIVSRFSVIRGRALPNSAAASSEKTTKFGRDNRSRDTAPEILRRKALWALGLRFRVNSPTLFGKPDIVFPGSRVVVFCDGNFWDGRNWKAWRAKLKRGSNAEYWVPKFARNIERDRAVTKAVHAEGWTVIRIWEGTYEQTR